MLSENDPESRRKCNFKDASVIGSNVGAVTIPPPAANPDTAVPDVAVAIHATVICVGFVKLYPAADFHKNKIPASR